MSYYASNGIYNYLIENQIPNFFWTSADKWILIYGDENREPRVVTLVSQYSFENEEIQTAEKNAIAVIRQLVENTDMHISFIRYCPKNNLEKVQYWDDSEKHIIEIDMNALRQRFISFGIKMNQQKASKPINDKSSSQYHDWQRQNMGNGVIVSDIDLLRFEGNRVKRNN